MNAERTSLTAGHVDSTAAAAKSAQATSHSGRRRSVRASRAVGDRLRLVLLSFLLLFVELALIRWTGSNVVYLSYFSNFVLLGSFLGIGVGFLRAGSRTNLFPWA